MACRDGFVANTINDIFRLVTTGKLIPPGLTTPCWLWTGAVDRDGYGLVHIKGKRHQAHIYIYEHFKGLVEPGKELDHRCRIRACVNWMEHLEPVSKEENLRRAGKYKLSDADVAAIRAIPAGQMSH